MANSNRALWKLPEMSADVEGTSMGSIRARFALSSASGSPTTVTANFDCVGSTLSGAEMELLSTGYRTSLVKRRFVAGAQPLTRSTSVLNFLVFGPFFSCILLLVDSNLVFLHHLRSLET